MKKATRILTRGTGAIFVAAVVMTPAFAGAVSDTKNTQVTANIGSSISMTTSGDVTINVVPTAGGSMSSASDTVAVSTNNSTGYTLTMTDADATTDLVSGSNTISADSGTQGTPSATLGANSWGYRVDDAGGFTDGPTTAESNVSSSAFKWAGVPASGAPDTLKTLNSTAANDTTTVWYGVKVDTSKPNGSYVDTVTYTATTN